MDLEFRPEDRVLYLLSRQQLDKTACQELRTCARSGHIDWAYILRIVTLHKIGPLACHHLGSLDVEASLPQWMVSRLRQRRMDNVIRKKGSRQVLAAILERLAACRLDVMLLKGEAYNQSIYRHSWFVEQSDIDLLFRMPRQAIDSALLAEVTRYIEGFNEQSSQYKEHIEYDFFAHHDIVLNGIARVDFGQIWQDASAVDYLNQRVYLMSREDMLIGATLNASRKRYFRLRSLMDINEIVLNTPDMDWAKICSRMAVFEVGPFAYAAMRATQATVGLSLPREVWDALPVASRKRCLIDGMMTYLLQRYDLAQLNADLPRSIFGRRFNRLLLLTYAAHPQHHLFRRFQHVLFGPRLADEPRLTKRAMPVHSKR